MKATQMKSLRPIIERLLTEYAHYRDDDRRLVAHLWMIQLGGVENMQKTSVYEFIKMWIDDHKYYNPEHICRMRRRIQEDNPSLRGTKYQERKQTEQQVRMDFSK